MPIAKSRNGWIALLPRFRAFTYQPITELSDSQQKLIVALALDDSAVSRNNLAVRIWPDATPRRASARLRQTLWRLNQTPAGELLRITQSVVGLADGVEVDFRIASQEIAKAKRSDLTWPAHIDKINEWDVWQHPLLSDWDLEWLHSIQQQWDLLRVQAMEKLAAQLLQRRDFGEVLRIADAAARADPLKETPRRIAVRACLCLGEMAGAHRRYLDYQTLLQKELGIAPSADFTRMLQSANQRPVSLARPCSSRQFDLLTGL